MVVQQNVVFDFLSEEIHMSSFPTPTSIAQATVYSAPELWPLLSTLLLLFVMSACVLVFTA